MVILLWATINLSQTRRRSSIRKSATIYYQKEESGSNTGIIYLTMNGQATAFTWWRELTQWYNINNNPRAREVGAEWRIVYDPRYDSEDEPYPKLISATFTGRVMSGNNQPSSPARAGKVDDSRQVDFKNFTYRSRGRTDVNTHSS